MARFSVWSCSRLGRVGLSKVTLPCLWILRGILSTPQRTVSGLLVSSKSLPFFVPLIFSTSSVGRLWICSCFGRFLCLDPFLINVVFPLVIHSGTCAVCRHLFISNASLSWMEVFFLNQKPWIPSWPGVFHFDISLMLFWVNLYLFPLSDLLQALRILSPCCLSIRPFRCVFWLPYFCPKSFSVFLHLIVGTFLCHFLPVVDRIFFRCFVMSCFVCIILPFVDISLITRLLPVLLFYRCTVFFFFSCYLFLFVPTYSSAFLSFYNFGLFL